MEKIICALFGHKDPIFAGVGFVSQDKLYENWKNWERNCERCDKNLKPLD
jgi:hypothetical protein